MKYWYAKLYNFWQLTRDSLLYVPVLFCLGFIAIGIGALQLDLHFGDVFLDKRFIYNGSPEKADDVIGLLLTSMITMTTLVISITMVVLSLSASQLGPRLVRIFMSDRRTKAYFGIFFGSIALCFTCLGILHDPITDSSTPRLTTSVTFAVCFFNLFVLLAYVNHVAQSGIADNIIARLTRELLESLDRIAVMRGSDASRTNTSGEAYYPDLYTHQKIDLCSATTGYVQSIQYRSLFKLALACDAFIQLHRRPGDHVVKGQKLGYIYSPVDNGDASAIVAKVQEAVLTGEYRSATQDIEYSIRHMVEIALRAMSPGVNDVFTATTVLDKLTGVLAHMTALVLPVYAFKDDQGHLRVSGASNDEGELIFKALSAIRHAGQNQRIILECLIANLATLKDLSNSVSQRSAIALQVEYIEIHIKQHFSGTPTQTLLQQALRDRNLASAG